MSSPKLVLGDIYITHLVLQYENLIDSCMTCSPLSFSLLVLQFILPPGKFILSELTPPKFISPNFVLSGFILLEFILTGFIIRTYILQIYTVSFPYAQSLPPKIYCGKMNLRG